MFNSPIGRQGIGKFPMAVMSVSLRLSPDPTSISCIISIAPSRVMVLPAAISTGQGVTLKAMLLNQSEVPAIHSDTSGALTFWTRRDKACVEAKARAKTNNLADMIFLQGFSRVNEIFFLTFR